ncbi:MAG: YebC/PmpR family DNA-binding transcriptional regulator [Acidiferrobacteraceae bacterium]|jgi:YebC/PmpR family DNA-binding regulatory protein
MAGHSKWANIRFRKGVQDARRGKIFTKYIREITVATRVGGSDIAHNPRLRTAIDKALAQNMPKDNIERAIKRGSGALDGADYEEVHYEGYTPGGAALFIECTTDNRNRTAGEVRHALAKHGGNLGTDGSVAYLFRKLTLLTFPASAASGDALLEAALEAGADDLVTGADGMVEVLAPPEALGSLRETLSRRGFPPIEAAVVLRPTTSILLAGDEAVQTMKLLDVLEDLDDVQNIYTNAEFPEELMSQSSA